ncbi:MAG: biopolymer transporter ExbD, partial [Lentisphaeria bacterium]|nr:biopolymer transporter ExbD [Lentisphaeria bacterium]
SFNGSAPMEVSRLRERLAAVAAADANSTIIIKCDPNVKYRKLIRVLDLCSELGLNSRQLVDKVKPFIPDPPPQRGRR